MSQACLRFLQFTVVGTVLDVSLTCTLIVTVENKNVNKSISPITILETFNMLNRDLDQTFCGEFLSFCQYLMSDSFALGDHILNFKI